MARQLVYHWKHGWIPLTHEAALSKAHGSDELARKLVPRTPDAGTHLRIAQNERAHPLGTRVSMREGGRDPLEHGTVIAHSDRGVIVRRDKGGEVTRLADDLRPERGSAREFGAAANAGQRANVQQAQRQARAERLKTVAPVQDSLFGTAGEHQPSMFDEPKARPISGLEGHTDADLKRIHAFDLANGKPGDPRIEAELTRRGYKLNSKNRWTKAGEGAPPPLVETMKAADLEAELKSADAARRVRARAEIDRRDAAKAAGAPRRGRIDYGTRHDNPTRLEVADAQEAYTHLGSARAEQIIGKGGLSGASAADLRKLIAESRAKRDYEQAAPHRQSLADATRAHMDRTTPIRLTGRQSINLTTGKVTDADVPDAHRYTPERGAAAAAAQQAEHDRRTTPHVPGGPMLGSDVKVGDRIHGANGTSSRVHRIERSGSGGQSFIIDNGGRHNVPKGQTVNVTTAEQMQAAADAREARQRATYARPTARAGEPVLVNPNVHDSKTTLGVVERYKLPSGHSVDIDARGRVVAQYDPQGVRMAGSSHPIEAPSAVEMNAHLFAQRRFGRSLQHDDHLVMKGHQGVPALRPGESEHPVIVPSTVPTPANVSQLTPRSEQSPRQIHDRLQRDPSKVTDDELARLDRLGGAFAPAARAEQAKRDAAKGGNDIPYGTIPGTRAHEFAQIKAEARAKREADLLEQGRISTRNASPEGLAEWRRRDAGGSGDKLAVTSTTVVHGNPPDGAAKVESDKRVQIEHSGDGTLLTIDRNDTEARAAAKEAGFRWSRNLNQWYLPRSYTEPTRRQKVEQLKRRIGEQHVHVADSGPGVSTTAAEREQAAREQAAERARRMDTRSQRHAAEADRRFGAADQISSHIPMGQPILVGHHSEARHRRDLARIHSNMDKGVEASQASRDAAHAAENARRAAAGDSPMLRQRRIERNEAEVRRIDRELADHELGTKLKAANPAKYEQVGYAIPIASDARLEQLRASRADLVDRIEHDKAQIAAAGHQAPDRAAIEPGDIVHYRGGAHVVSKVNQKTVSIPTGYSWEDKVPISQIERHTKMADLSDGALKAAVRAAGTNNPKLRARLIRELERRGISVGDV